jgi:hypothetical protein
MKSQVWAWGATCLAAFLVSGLEAAHLEHAGSGLWIQSGGYSANATESDPYDDPATPWREWYFSNDFDPWFIETGSSPSISTAFGDAYGTADAVLNAQDVTLTFLIEASGQTTTTDSSMYVYTNPAGLEPAVTDGIFYRIVSDSEPAGTPVRVRLQWNAQAQVTGMDYNGYIWIGGPGSVNDILVSVNGGPGDGAPPAESVVYRHPSLIYYDEGLHNDSDSVVISAAVGDVLGLYLGCQAYVYADNAIRDKTVSGEFVFAVEVLESTTNPADINNDRKVDIEDLAMLALNWLWTAPPAFNQTCDNALLVQDGKVYRDSTAGTDTGELWYQLRPAEDAIHVVSLCGSDFDTRLTAYERWTGSEPCPGNYWGENDDDCDQQSQLELICWDYTTYYFKVESPSSEQGNVRLEITKIPRPENDETPAEAVLDTVYTGSTAGSFYDAWVWYQFTPQESDFYTVSLCGSSFDTVLELYDEQWSTVLDYNDNACGMQSELPFYLEAGVSYIIAVGAWSDRGDYQFQITRGVATPVNDDCTNAMVLYRWDQVEGSTIAAGGEDISSCGDGDSQDVWYRFTAPYDAAYGAQLWVWPDYSVKTLTIYDASGCPGTEIQGAETDENGWVSITLPLTISQEVLIRVGGIPGLGGQYKFAMY